MPKRAQTRRSILTSSRWRPPPKRAGPPFAWCSIGASAMGVSPSLQTTRAGRGVSSQKIPSERWHSIGHIWASRFASKVLWNASPWRNPTPIFNLALFRVRLRLSFRARVARCKIPAGSTPISSHSVTHTAENQSYVLQIGEGSSSCRKPLNFGLVASIGDMTESYIQRRAKDGM